MKKRHLGYSSTCFALGYGAGRFLPRAACQGIGGALGLASYLGKQESRDALRGNLARATGLAGADLQSLCRKNFCNFGRMLADYFYCASKEPAAIRALLSDWHGIDRLKDALALGRGAVLATAHLGNWELGGALLALDGWPINVVTLEEPSTELTEMRDAYRRRLGIRTIAVGRDKFAFIGLMQALRRNEIVCMLVDRPYAETGTPVELFGHATCFSSGPALLSQHTGAAVVPAFVLRTASGRYQAFTEPAVALEPSFDRQDCIASNTQRIATVFESIIRSHPEQWFNYVPIWKNETAPASHAGV